MIEEEEDYSPYCKNCDGCGEDGCCNAIHCAYSSMVTNQDKGCSYGETYYSDLAFYYHLGQDLYNLIKNSGDKELKEKLNKLYDKLYDEIYKE